MPDRMKERTRSRPSSRGGTLFLIGAVLAIAFVSWRFIEATGAEDFLRHLGPLAPLASVPIHVVLSATPFPSEMVGLANGAVYGLWLGAACSWLGWWCGAILEFTLVRRGASGIEASAGLEKLPEWLSRFPVGHPVFLIVGRQLPFGFHLVNVLAGVAQVRTTRFVVCAAISNLPYAWITAAMGAGLVASWH